MSAAADVITEGENRILSDLVNKLDALGSDNLDTLSEETTVCLIPSEPDETDGMVARHRDEPTDNIAAQNKNDQSSVREITDLVRLLCSEGRTLMQHLPHHVVQQCTVAIREGGGPLNALLKQKMEDDISQDSQPTEATANGNTEMRPLDEYDAAVVSLERAIMSNHFSSLSAQPSETICSMQDVRAALRRQHHTDESREEAMSGMDFESLQSVLQCEIDDALLQAQRQLVRLEASSRPVIADTPVQEGAALEKHSENGGFCAVSGAVGGSKGGWPEEDGNTKRNTLEILTLSKASEAREGVEGWGEFVTSLGNLVARVESPQKLALRDAVEGGESPLAASVRALLEKTAALAESPVKGKGGTGRAGDNQGCSKSHAEASGVAGGLHNLSAPQTFEELERALAFELWGAQGPHGSNAADEIAGGGSKGGMALGSERRGLLNELAWTLSPKPRRLLEELSWTLSPRRGRDAGDSGMSLRSADEPSDFSRCDGLSQNWGEGRGWEVVSKDFVEFEGSAELSLASSRRSVSPTPGTRTTPPLQRQRPSTPARSLSPADVAAHSCTGSCTSTCHARARAQEAARRIEAEAERVAAAMQIQRIVRGCQARTGVGMRRGDLEKVPDGDRHQITQVRDLRALGGSQIEEERDRSQIEEERDLAAETTCLPHMSPRPMDSRHAGEEGGIQTHVGFGSASPGLISDAASARQEPARRVQEVAGLVSALNQNICSDVSAPISGVRAPGSTGVKAHKADKDSKAGAKSGQHKRSASSQSMSNLGNVGWAQQKLDNNRDRECAKSPKQVQQAQHGSAKRLSPTTHAKTPHTCTPQKLTNSLKLTSAALQPAVKVSPSSSPCKVGGKGASTDAVATLFASQSLGGSAIAGAQHSPVTSMSSASVSPRLRRQQAPQLHSPGSMHQTLVPQASRPASSSGALGTLKRGASLSPRRTRPQTHQASTHRATAVCLGLKRNAHSFRPTSPVSCPPKTVNEPNVKVSSKKTKGEDRQGRGSEIMRAARGDERDAVCVTPDRDAQSVIPVYKELGQVRNEPESLSTSERPGCCRSLDVADACATTKTPSRAASPPSSPRAASPLSGPLAHPIRSTMRSAGRKPAASTWFSSVDSVLRESVEPGNPAEITNTQGQWEREGKVECDAKIAGDRDGHSAVASPESGPRPLASPTVYAEAQDGEPCAADVICELRAQTSQQQGSASTDDFQPRILSHIVGSSETVDDKSVHAEEGLTIGTTMDEEGDLVACASSYDEGGDVKDTGADCAFNLHKDGRTFGAPALVAAAHLAVQGQKDFCVVEMIDDGQLTDDVEVGLIGEERSKEPKDETLRMMRGGGVDESGVFAHEVRCIADGAGMLDGNDADLDEDAERMIASDEGECDLAVEGTSSGSSRSLAVQEVKQEQENLRPNSAMPSKSEASTAATASSKESASKRLRPTTATTQLAERKSASVVNLPRTARSAAGRRVTRLQYQDGLPVQEGRQVGGYSVLATGASQTRSLATSGQYSVSEASRKRSTAAREQSSQRSVHAAASLGNELASRRGSGTRTAVESQCFQRGSGGGDVHVWARTKKVSRKGVGDLVGAGTSLWIPEGLLLKPCAFAEVRGRHSGSEWAVQGEEVGGGDAGVVTKFVCIKGLPRADKARSPPHSCHSENENSLLNEVSESGGLGWVNGGGERAGSEFGVSGRERSRTTSPSRVQDGDEQRWRVRQACINLQTKRAAMLKWRQSLASSVTGGVGIPHIAPLSKFRK